MSKKNENINIIYSAILRQKHTILSEYTECSGNFSQIITVIIKDVVMKFENPPNSYRTYFYYGKYAFFIIKSESIYLLTMIPNTKNNNTDKIFSLLYCLYENFKNTNKINFSEASKMKPYSLAECSSIFKENIKCFCQNINSFNKYLKYHNNFELYEPFEDRYFEKDTHLPILSNEQVHTLKEEEDTFEEFEEIIENEKSNVKRNKSYNSAKTNDSFNDDILKEITELDGIIIKGENDEYNNENLFHEKKRKNFNIKRIKNVICFIIVILIFTGIFLAIFFSLK